MQLAPRYGDSPVMSFHTDPTAIIRPFVRQRQRLGRLLESLADEQWAAQSRCSEWSVSGVVSHLTSTNRFWETSARLGLVGQPTQFLATFDPVASPAQLVNSLGDTSPAQVLADHLASVASLAELAVSLTPEQCMATAEAPPGHISLSLVLHHALWDSWIHERDIALPLGLVVACEDDELAACLQYSAALAPALGIQLGADVQGRYAVQAVNPVVAFTTTVDTAAVLTMGVVDNDPCLRGECVELIEAITARAPFPAGVPDEWLKSMLGLNLVFDGVGPNGAAA